MSDEFRIIACDGALTIARVQDLRAALLDVWPGAGAVLVDCSGAVQVDTSFIQVLVAARKSAERDGVALSVRADADGPLWAAVRALGLADDFIVADAASFNGAPSGADHDQGEHCDG